MNKTVRLSEYAVMVDRFMLEVTKTRINRAIIFKICNFVGAAYECDITFKDGKVELIQPNQELKSSADIARRSAALKLATEIVSAGPSWTPLTSEGITVATVVPDDAVTALEDTVDDLIVKGIEKRLAAITPYPWALHKEASSYKDDCPCGMIFAADGNAVVSVPAGEDWTDITIPEEQIKANARFIAHAPQDIEFLLKKLDDAQKK